MEFAVYSAPNATDWPLWRRLLFLMREAAILAYQLSKSLGIGIWVVQFVRLLMYAASLTPGWVYLVRHYFYSGDIILDIPYGRFERNRLDVYPAVGDGGVRYTMPIQRLWWKSSSELPTPTSRNRPVIVLISGGAWTIGYKAWTLYTARTLQLYNCIVVSPDYRNFPQTDIPGMIYDVAMAVQWTMDNISHFGGDRKQIYIVGQSAGAHLAFMAMLEVAGKQLLRKVNVLESSMSSVNVDEGNNNHSYDDLHITESILHLAVPSHHRSIVGEYIDKVTLKNMTAYDPSDSSSYKIPRELVCGQMHYSAKLWVPEDSTRLDSFALRELEESVRRVGLGDDVTWGLGDVAMFMGVSGMYDTLTCMKHLNSRGMPSNTLYAMMQYKPHLFSATRMLRAYGNVLETAKLRHEMASLPRLKLYHGVVDKTSPFLQSFDLACAVASTCDIDIDVSLWPHKGHTDVILEDPMSGYDVLSSVILGNVYDRQISLNLTPTCPKWLVKLARLVNPF